MDTLPSPEVQPQFNPWASILEPEQPKFSFWGLIARRKWLILLCLTIGLGLAYLYFTQAPERFQSSAKVRIRPRNQAQVTLVQNENILPGQESVLKRHDKDILSERTIRGCFEQSEEIKRMGIFDGMSDEERIRRVMEDLDVDRDEEDGEVFELSFTSTNAMDAKTMLNSILTTYERELEMQFSTESDRVVTTFKGVKAYLQEYINERQKKRNEIYRLAEQNEVSDIVVDNGNLTLHNRKVGELLMMFETIKRNRAQIGSEIQWIHGMVTNKATADAQQAVQGAAAATDQAIQEFSEAQATDVPTTDDPSLAAHDDAPLTITDLAPPADSTAGEPGTDPSSALAASLQEPTTEDPTTPDAAVAGADQEGEAVPTIPEDTAPSAQELSDQMKVAVKFVQEEEIKDDPVPTWINEIFKSLEQPNKAAGGIVLTLALVRKMDRTSEYNRGFDPDSRATSDRTRAEMEFQQRIDQLLIDREIKTQHLGPKNPEIVVIDQAIERYKAMIAKLYETPSVDGAAEAPKPITDEQFLMAYVNDLALKYNEIVTQIPGLMKDLTFHYRRAEMLSEISRQLKDADEEVQMFRKFLEETVATLAQINPRYIDQGYVNKDNEGFLFIRLNEPSLGERVWPDLVIILSLGGFLGSMLGFGLGYLVELSDKTFHNPDEIMKQLSMPLIGHIPVIQQSKRHVIENSFIDPSICVYHRPKSQSSEAFRAIRTALFFSTKGKMHSVIQITSPTPGDGKSTIAANLAVSIAQSGKRVLLLDADMRRPSIHHAFGIKTQEGFPQVLLGEKTWRAAIYECEEIPGLSILPCGARPANPAELISTPRVGELIEEMRSHFDFIIMDTPPVLAVTDPCPVAARVDGVILTIRIKKNVKISSDRATEILNSVGANLIGVVVNGVGNQSGYGSQYSYGAYRAGYQYNGYGYGYGYSYGSGKRGDDEKPSRPVHVPNLQAPQSSDAGIST